MKKVLSLLLALFTLLSLLAACTVASSDPAETVPVTDAAETSAESGGEGSQALTDNLPADLQFDGKKFRMLSYRGANTFEGNGWVLYLDIDEPTQGDLLETAAFRRNAELKDRFKVDFELEADVFNWDNEKGDITYFRNVIASSGDDMYDVAFLQNGDKSAFVIEELLYDVNSLPCIDWDKPYYNQAMNDLYQLGSKRFLIFSDTQYTCFSAPMVLVNTSLLTDLGYDKNYLYTVVDDNEWTIDKMASMIRNQYNDLDQDDKPSAGDKFGYVCSRWGGMFMLGGTEVKGTYLTDSGIAFDYGTPYTVSVVDKIMQFLDTPDFFNCEGDDMISIFNNGRALFMSWASELRALRDWEAEYGILPNPKYDENQASYSAIVSGVPLLVPYTIGDPEFVGAMIEAMASGSARYLKPAFYQNFIQQKVIRDDGSRSNWERMLSTWSRAEFVNLLCPDTRLLFFGPAGSCIINDYDAYSSYWDKQEAPLSRTCSEFYGYFMID